MTPRIESLRDYIVEKKHIATRRTVDWDAILPPEEGSTRCSRAADILRAVLAEEAKTPVFLPNETIAFTRSCANLPERYSDETMAKLRKEAYFHEKGVVFNLSPHFADTMAVGLDARRAEVLERLERAKAEHDDAGIDFLHAVISGIDAILNLSDAYQKAAAAQGLTLIAETLQQVPRHPARSFHEALQFLRILHYALWCEGAYHNGVGRFDQFLMPYLEKDLAAGVLTEETALEMLEEFFLTFNRDSDLYVGVQQGDNGQSMMLGGCKKDGSDAVNPLTYLALRASCELKLIDPKINLRVSSQTPMKLLEAATELTRQGLGFPQYANDDVVIPGLTRLGYSLEDARDYTVAACWEFIIPGVGMDIPNIAAVSFPAVVNRVMRSAQGKATDSFPSFMHVIREELFAEADRIAASLEKVDMLPCPMVSLLCDGRVEKGRDLCEGSRYNNFGIHGTGLAPAVDSLEVIQKLVFEKKELTLDELAACVDANFHGYEKFLSEARNAIPKMGNDDDEADAIGVELLTDFADSWENRINCRGGIYRAGTGSAMYYIWHANELPASPDGRLEKEPFPANYAPSLNVQVAGPISVVKSFTKPDLSRVINGGPLTIELHDSVFRHEQGISRVASLVKLFVDRGGHQLQINTINRDQLLDAQEHPEQYHHLIVRVWGWSGYFVELDKPYQDQIIKRAEMTL
ncbi:MAG: pyruvate formate lyase family protein [Planctomycetia bacterium]|nr:pyruvate formate lyase family protein [Planctomycetia bacterium]